MDISDLPTFQFISGSSVAEVIADFASILELPLNPRDQPRIPANTANSLADNCVDIIRFLYYKDPSALDTCLQAAKVSCRLDRSRQDEALRNLFCLLKAQRSNGQSFTSQSISASTITSFHTSANASFDRTESTTTSFTTVQESDEDLPTLRHKRNVSSEHQNTALTGTSLSLDYSKAATSTTAHNYNEDMELIGGAAELSSELLNVSNNSHVKTQDSNAGCLEQYKIRDLPGQGFFVENLNFSPELNWKQRYNLTCSAIADDIKDTNSELRHNIITNINAVNNMNLADSVVDPKPVKETLSGRLRYALKRDPSVFTLQLEPIKSSIESNRFHRTFGSHRFLSLKIPSLSSAPPEYSKGQRKHLISRIQEWLMVEHKPFMGWFWTAMYVRPIKRHRKHRKRLEEGDAYGYEAVFFATHGPGLPSLSVTELINWFIDFDLNKELQICKAYARIQLGLSATVPTITFLPNQIQCIRDTLADGTREDDSFNAKELTWHDMHNEVQPRVMDDGCSLISARAAGLIWQELHLPGAVPSTFQARIGPWKGLWSCSAGQIQDLNLNGDLWIRVTDSQRKFMPQESDIHNHSSMREASQDHVADEQRRTFEVCDWARRPSSSSLYLEFLPILEARGVSREALHTFVIDSLDSEKYRLLTSLESNISLRRWIQALFNSAINSEGDLEAPWLGGMPVSSIQKASLLLESGFEIISCRYLADVIEKLTQWHFNRLCLKLYIPISKSTLIFGIADPTRTLHPGEIHLGFSTSFEGLHMLHDFDVLVARHPACRASDVQKVKARYNLALRHIVDVVVFPATGCYPLASKLQGGDYDGDRFWVCWEEILTQPFRNAPPPLNTPEPEYFGITVDNSRLETLLLEPDHKKFLHRNFAFQFQDSLLGICTQMHEKICYHQNSISSTAADMLVHLHDYLVDAPKNGYSFSWEAWNTFQKRHIRKDWRALPKPAFRKAADEGFEQASRAKNSNNLTDYLMFDVAWPHITETIRQYKVATQNAITWDPDLVDLFSRCKRSQDKLVASVANRLHEELYSVFVLWPQHFDNKSKKETDALFKEATRKCRERFAALSISENEYIALFGRTPHTENDGPRYWDRLKASALFYKYHGKYNFVFQVVGRELGYIKAWKTGNPRTVIERIHRTFKVSKAKRVVKNEDVAEEEDSEDGLDTEWDDTDEEPDQYGAGMDNIDIELEKMDVEFNQLMSSGMP